jgi:hypothetical protein
MLSVRPKRFPWWTLFAGIAAVLGNIAACLPWAYSLLFLMQPDSHGRLIVEAFMTGVASLVALIVTFPLACLAFVVDRRRLLGVIFMCMAFTPFPLAAVTLSTVAAVRHITLDD